MVHEVYDIGFYQIKTEVVVLVGLFLSCFLCFTLVILTVSHDFVLLTPPYLFFCVRCASELVNI